MEFALFYEIPGRSRTTTRCGPRRPQPSFTIGVPPEELGERIKRYRAAQVNANEGRQRSLP